jgi:rSAM/selenodomain-associated transferase 2
VISIIVPVKNEAMRLPALLDAIASLPGEKEIIVVDGGSTDGSQEICRDRCRLIETRPGRGHQLHRGAMAATGEVLWFLHADATVEPGSLLAIETALGGENAPLYGHFKMYFDDTNHLLMRLLALTSNLRARHLRLVFGDQGLFISREAYFQTGGFRPLPLMEDWEYSRRLSKKGRGVQVKVPLGTSGRRYLEGGFFRTLFFMHRIKWWYLRGVAPEELARRYREVRS